MPIHWSVDIYLPVHMVLISKGNEKKINLKIELEKFSLSEAKFYLSKGTKFWSVFPWSMKFSWSEARFYLSKGKKLWSVFP